MGISIIIEPKFVTILFSSMGIPGAIDISSPIWNIDWSQGINVVVPASASSHKFVAAIYVSGGRLFSLPMHGGGGGGGAGGKHLLVNLD